MIVMNIAFCFLNHRMGSKEEKDRLVRKIYEYVFSELL